MERRDQLRAVARIPNSPRHKGAATGHLFNALEAPNTAITTKAEDLWPLALTTGPVTSFDSSGLFGAFGGFDGGRNWGSTLLSEGALEGRGLHDRAKNMFLAINGMLFTLPRTLAIVAVIHRVWRTFSTM